MELALWTHYIVSVHKPELLDGIPGINEVPAVNEKSNHATTNGDQPSENSNQESTSNDTNVTETPTLLADAASTTTNGKSAPSAALDENSTTTSFTEDSMDKPATPQPRTVPSAVVGATTVASEDTNDSIPTNEDSNSNLATTPRPTDEESEPASVTEEDDSQDAVSEPPTKKSKK